MASSTTKDEYADPLFLHPSDNPSSVVVSQPLTESNWRSWSNAMRMALEGKNKLGFIDGSVPKPSVDDPKQQSWKRNNSIIASWIMNSVSKDIAASISYTSTASDIWNDLKIRFQKKNGPRIFKIKRDLMNLKQGDLTITQYYTKVKSYWEELAEFQPPNTCTCGGIKPWMDHHNMDQVILFLTGLNDSYSHVRGQILLMDPMPPMNQVFSLVNQEETQRELGVTHPLQDTSSVFAVQAPDNKFKQNQKDRPFCEECKKYGHTKNTCFKIHGYPAHIKREPPFLHQIIILLYELHLPNYQII
uniref:Retrotransposon Copia-like N-terminal domain-containing protein n=1 Tax=Cajanus cajan TaxID=3821 RepID=A0A151QT53_CAJCA|nr:hypothetical protein KK1_045698 [Cajanus cajan]